MNPCNACSSRQLVFVKPDFRKYEAASAATREVFKQYDPHFEAGSLDEAYLDVTDYCAAHGMTGEQVRQLSGS
jgi:DNA polymerase kappa